MDRLGKPLNALLKMAVLAGVETAVKLHIRRGDDLDARDGAGATPLMLAAGRGKIGVISLLLNAGADPTLVDTEGRDALSYARKSGNSECETIVLLAMSRNERADDSEVSLAESEVAAQETPASLMERAEAHGEACWAPEEDLAPPAVNSRRGEGSSQEPNSVSVADASQERSIFPPSFIPFPRAQIWSQALLGTADSPADSPSDFWEAEAAAVAPEGSAQVTVEARALHESICRHKALDDSEDWSDVEIFLPERAAPIISDAESETLRQLLLRALSEGSVPAIDVVNACANADGSLNLEAEQILGFVLGDIGSDIDERVESGEEPWCLPESAADEGMLHESLEYLTDLSAGRNDPARYYVKAFRRKLLAADQEIALAKEMEDAGQEALAALARWPGGISIVLDFATKALSGSGDERACFDSREQSENAEVESDDQEREEGDESRNGDGASEAGAGRFAVLAAEIRKAGGSREGIEACLREAGFSRSFLARLADSSEGHEAAEPFRAAIRRHVAARDRMVLSNLRLSFSIAKKYLYSGEPLDDLVQEGNIGLMKAVERYEWRKGFRFSTYATWWIRQQITRYIADRSRTIRIPVHLHEKLSKALRERDEFEATNHRPEKLSEMADRLGMREGRLASILAVFEDTLSLDSADSTSGLPLIESLPGPGGDDPSAKADAASLSGILRRMVSEFDERSAEVITLRFGLSGEDAMTLEEVGQHFGVTRERIRQVEAKALRKLSHQNRQDELAYFVPGREARPKTNSEAKPKIVPAHIRAYSALPSAQPRQVTLPDLLNENAVQCVMDECCGEAVLPENSQSPSQKEADATCEEPSSVVIGEVVSDWVAESESDESEDEVAGSSVSVEKSADESDAAACYIEEEYPAAAPIRAPVLEPRENGSAAKEYSAPKKTLRSEAPRRSACGTKWLRGGPLTFHSLFLRGRLRDTSSAVEWLEGYDEAQGFFGEGPIEFRGNCEFGLELSASGDETPECLALFSEALTQISAAWDVEIDWLSTTSSRGCHTLAQRIVAGVRAAVFDGSYYFTSVDEAEDASMLQNGDADALERHAERFCASVESLNRLGSGASLEDDARLLSLGWHLCLAENVVPALWLRRQAPAFWEKARNIVDAAQERSEVLEFGETENILSLMGEVLDFGPSLGGEGLVSKPLRERFGGREGLSLPDVALARANLLFMAAAAGSHKSVGIQVNRGDDLDVKDKDGKTPLMIAARHNHPKVCKVLLDAGAELIAKDRGGSSALGIAMRCGSNEAQAVLLKARNAMSDQPAQRKPSSSLKAASEEMLLNLAKRRGTDKAVRIHIQFGDNLNVRDPSGRTPLMISAMRNNASVCRILLDAGADWRLRDDSGRDALSLARESSAATAASAIEEFLLERNLCATASEAHVDVQPEDPTGLEPSVEACLPRMPRTGLLDLNYCDSNSLEKLGDLVRKCDDIDSTDSKGRTALMLAASGANANACRILLEAGANPALRDNRNWGAIAYAMTANAAPVAALIRQALATSVGKEIAGSASSVPPMSPSMDLIGHDSVVEAEVSAFSDDDLHANPWFADELHGAPKNNERVVLSVARYNQAVSNHVPIDGDAEWNIDPTSLPARSLSPRGTGKPLSGLATSAPRISDGNAPSPNVNLPASFLEAAKRLRDNSAIAKSELVKSEFLPTGVDDSIMVERSGGTNPPSAPVSNSRNARASNYTPPDSFLEAARRLRDHSAIANSNNSNIDKLLDEARSLGFKVDDQRAVGGGVEVLLPAVKELHARSLARRLVRSGFKTALLKNEWVRLHAD